MTSRRTFPAFRTAAAARARRLRSWLDRLRAWAGRQPRLRALGALWNGLLADACDLVAPVVSRLVVDRRLIAVPRRTGGLDFFLAHAGVVTPVAAPPQDAGSRARLELRLRADQTVEHTLTLPGASRDYLDTIIDHRVERLVPWRRETVRHGYAVLDGGEPGGPIAVRVLLTSADIVAGPVAELAKLGFAPAVIGGCADRLSDQLLVTLGGGSSTARPGWHRTLGRVWLAGTAGLCACAVLSAVFAVGAEGRRLEAERHLAKARRLVRQAGDTAASDTLPVLADKTPDKAAMVLIDKLAAAIPDTSYLRELALTPEEVRLTGVAADAPALIPLIEKAGLYNVRFTGPVSRGEDKRDSFEITADRAPAKEAP